MLKYYNITKKIKRLLLKPRTNTIVRIITKLLENNEKVLDFGCGDLLVAESIMRKKNVKIVGVDIINNNLTGIPFQLYDGKRLPFKDKTFDTTYISAVFHHCNNNIIEEIISECVRVTKRKLIILEDVYENKLALFFAKFFDILYTIFSPKINLAFNFKTVSEWEEIFERFNISKIRVNDFTLFPGDPVKRRIFLLNLK